MDGTVGPADDPTRAVPHAPAVRRPGTYSAAMFAERGILALSLLVSTVAWPILAPGAPSAGAAVSQQPSAGCRSGAVPPVSGSSVNFSAAGDTGSYVVEGPSHQRPGQALPLVIDLHGYSETAGIQVVVSKLGDYGATHGFLTVTPQVNEAVQHWITSPHSADQRFLIALIDHAASTLCVDRHRIFVAGYSNGAFMASALACSDARTIAAVATVAGIEADAGCHPSRRVPVIAFHGTADPFVPYKGGIGPAAKNLPATDGKGTIGSNLAAKSNQRHPAERPARPGRGGPVGRPERLFEVAEGVEGDQGRDADHVPLSAQRLGRALPRERRRSYLGREPGDVGDRVDRGEDHVLDLGEPTHVEVLREPPAVEL